MSTTTRTRRTTGLLASALAAGTLALAACGSGAAPVASTSDSGTPAAWIGTKGVEFTVVNKSDSALYVWRRSGGEVKKLNRNDQTTFQGESSGADDLEIVTSWNQDGSAGVELDGSNPSIGYPGISVYPVSDGKRCGFRFNEGERFLCNTTMGGQDTHFSLKRLGDGSDHKRFTIHVCRGHLQGTYDCEGS